MAAVKRRVANRISLGDDYELHVSNLTVKDERFVELRYYIPSQKSYGRGVVLPPDAVESLIAALLGPL